MLKELIFLTFKCKHKNYYFNNIDSFVNNLICKLNLQKYNLNIILVETKYKLCYCKFY